MRETTVVFNVVTVVVSVNEKLCDCCYVEINGTKPCTRCVFWEERKIKMEKAEEIKKRMDPNTSYLKLRSMNLSLSKEAI